MILVWVLILVIGSPGANSGGGPTIIDNIYSAEECSKVKRMIDRQMRDGYHSGSTTCIPVMKVRT